MYSRRDILSGVAAAALGSALPMRIAQAPLRTPALNSLPPSLWASIHGSAFEMWTRAARCGTTSPSVVIEGMKNLANITPVFADYLQANAVAANFESGLTLSANNPDWLTFTGNHAGLVAPKEYFTLIKPSEVSGYFGIPDTMSLNVVDELRSVSTKINDFTSNFDRFQPMGGAGNGFGTESYLADQALRAGAIAASGLGLATLGVRLIAMAGGITVVNSTVLIGVTTPPILLGTIGTIAAWSGIGLVILGVGVAGYGIYRLVKNMRGDDSPWQDKVAHSDHQPRLSNRQGMYPPLLDASLMPSVRSRIYY